MSKYISHASLTGRDGRSIGKQLRPQYPLLACCRTLNRIQSRIYPTALNSNQNLLVCAPTGAGKTNIAMLAVLHEVGQNMRHGVIQRQNFKVVYVAPMKALAAEVTGAFSRRLGPLGRFILL